MVLWLLTYIQTDSDCFDMLCIQSNMHQMIQVFWQSAAIFLRTSGTNARTRFLGLECASTMRCNVRLQSKHALHVFDDRSFKMESPLPNDDINGRKTWHGREEITASDQQRKKIKFLIDTWSNVEQMESLPQTDL